MALETRTPSSLDDWRPFAHVIVVAFGEMPEDPDLEKERDRLEAERSTRLRPLDLRVGVVDVADDGTDAVLGGCQSYVFDLTLPGGGRVPASGLSSVGVDPTKQGRGALRVMIAEHLRRARERGHAVGTLNASESSIYAQFGYGPATAIAEYLVDADRAVFRSPIDDEGTVELVAVPGRSPEVFIEAYQRLAGAIPGTTSRSNDWWQITLGDEETWLGGGKQIGIVHRNGAGEVDGYALYKVDHKPDWVNDNTVRVLELMAATAEAELALFRYLVGVPLTRRVRWTHAPLDPVVRHHLRDPRQLKEVDQHDLLWVRVLDVPTVLEQRSYDVPGNVTLTVDDPMLPEVGGSWRLSVDNDGTAIVESIEGMGAVRLSIAQLGSVVLGGTRVAELARAGLVTGDSSAVNQLDRLLVTDRLPFNLSKF